MSKKIKISFISFVLLVLVVLVGAGNYFYNYAVVPSDKSFLSSSNKQTSLQKKTQSWFDDKENRSRWRLTSADQLQLSAIYLPVKNADKTVIIAHGYMGEAEDMAQYAKMYHDLGYNVLVPDARGHGESQGNYIGFGWDERRDYLAWIQKVLQKTGNHQNIVLHGVSMGAATVMMTSGEKLPKNVKAIIEDCGYASVTEELSYQLKELFSLPAFPLIPVTSLVTKARAGYFFGEASAVKQLAKNKLPMLFIHGDQDDFVPFSMLEEVYAATNGPKEKYVVKGAGHAKAWAKNPAKYQKKVSQFLEQYAN